MKLELPFEHLQFEVILQGQLSKVINKYGLAANFLHPKYKGRRFANNAHYVTMKNNFFQENLSPQGLQELEHYTNETGAFQRIFRQRYNEKVFWRCSRFFFPELSALAEKLLHLPVSTGDLERLFSEWH